jgi:hypothetical protein
LNGIGSRSVQQNENAAPGKGTPFSDQTTRPDNNKKLGESSMAYMGCPARRRKDKYEPACREALECMQLEDDLVNALSGPGCTANRVQAAAALMLAGECARRWRDYAEAMAAASARTPIYHLSMNDLSWLADALESVHVLSDAGIMKRLEKIVGDTRHDLAAVASINAARWIWRWHTAGAQASLPN